MTRWRLVSNWGNYGSYGWGLGFWYEKVTTADGWVEATVVLQFGPWKAMFDRKPRRLSVSA